MEGVLRWRTHRDQGKWSEVKELGLGQGQKQVYKLGVGAKAEAGGNGSIIRPRARGQDTQGLRGRVLKAPQS